MSRISADEASAKDRLCEAVGAVLSRATGSVFLSVTSKEWIYPLMASLICARCNGVRIVVEYFPERRDSRQSKRLALLRNLGCDVAVMGYSCGSNEVHGAVSDPLRHAEYVLFGPGGLGEGQDRLGEVHGSGEAAEELLRRARIRMMVPEKVQVRQQLARVSEESVSASISRVPFYVGSGVSLRSIDISLVRPTQSRVRAFKVRQAAVLFEFFRERGLVPFEPCAASLADGSWHLVVPPVVEEHSSELFLVEGHSRCYLALQREIREISLLVVQGVDACLPALPRAWKEVAMAGGGQGLQESIRADRRKHNLARRVEDWTHWRVRCGQRSEANVQPDKAKDEIAPEQWGEARVGGTRRP